MTDTLAEMRPSIGKRVYAVMIESMTVVPAVVKEKVIRETINGIATSYLLDFGAQGKTSVPSTSLRGHTIVDSPEAAYEILRNHIAVAARNWHDQQMDVAKKNVQAAVTNANKRFGPPPAPEPTEEPMPEDIDDDVSVQELMRLAAMEHARELMETSQEDVVPELQPQPQQAAGGPKAVKSRESSPNTPKNEDSDGSKIQATV